MKHDHDHTPSDPLRRRRLLQWFAAGSGVALLPACTHNWLYQAMPRPEEMPDDMSVFSFRGVVVVNDARVAPDTRIMPGDIIRTESNSAVVFVVDEDAFMIGENSRLAIPARMTDDTYRLNSGRALGVFASRRMAIATPTALVNIRGTGVYLEVDDQRTYVCTCYGKTELGPIDDPTVRETLETTQHESPRYIYGEGSEPRRIEPAPFKNHANKELDMIETLVGRKMPATMQAR